MRIVISLIPLFFALSVASGLAALAIRIVSRRWAGWPQILFLICVLSALLWICTFVFVLGS